MDLQCRSFHYMDKSKETVRDILFIQADHTFIFTRSFRLTYQSAAGLLLLISLSAIGEYLYVYI